MATDTLVSERERLYKASAGKPEIVLVPEMSFVMIDGHGDPNTSQDYKDTIEALYTLSYTVKFALKKEQGLQFRVGPLEGLWWAEDMAAFDLERKGDWNWTMMIAQPDAVTRHGARSSFRRSPRPGSSASRREPARRSCTSGR